MLYILVIQFIFIYVVLFTICNVIWCSVSWSALVNMNNLPLQCRDMQQVIIEDRTEKERLRILHEKEQRERDAAIKVKRTCRQLSGRVD